MNQGMLLADGSPADLIDPTLPVGHTMTSIAEKIVADQAAVATAQAALDAANAILAADQKTQDALQPSLDVVTKVEATLDDFLKAVVGTISADAITADINKVQVLLEEVRAFLQAA